MRNSISKPALAILAGLAAALAACSSEAPDEGALTETELGDVDVIEGTISDDMIEPDAVNAEATEEAEEAAEADDDESETSEGDGAQSDAGQEDAAE